VTDPTPIAVTSRSFSRHPVLRAELLARYTNVVFNDKGESLRGDALVEFLRGKVKAITALEPVDDALLDQLPDLGVISKVGVGIDMLDVDAVKRHGVRLAWTPGTNSRSVSELTLALVLALLRDIVPANAEVRSGEWRQRKGTTLTGKTVGIVGFGNVGRFRSTLLAPFECRLLAADVRKLDGVEQVELDDLLRTADVVTLHLELNEATRNILDRSRLELMRPDAVLVNTSRGGLVDEDALKELLTSGRLAGAAFDVFAVEPPGDRELLNLPTFLVTPHIGGSTEEAILAMGRAAIAGLDDAPGW
jgi:Phosphoglycerate dehydrogenase and related dehydrogenases